MELCVTLMTIILIAICIKICDAESQINYVKPNGNITCPGDPCMTLGAYIEASEMYFVSDTTFTFLPGEHYYDSNLRLSNVTDILFQGEDALLAGSDSVWIRFTPGSNMTFITSNKIVLRNLSILLSGLWNPTFDLYRFFASIFFRISSAQLSNIVVVGDNSSFFSTAFFGRQCYIEMTNIQITQAKSLNGAALYVFNNSTVILSGNNTFNHNSAVIGGAIVIYGSFITISGTILFERNVAVLNGGAMLLDSNTVINISGKAVFLRNSANFSGGAIQLDSTILLLKNDGILHFTENSARILGGAVSMNMSNARIKGQMTIQHNVAQIGGAFSTYLSTVKCTGKSLFINNLAAALGGAVFLRISSKMFAFGAKFENNHATVGGALHISDNSCISILDSFIVNNSAKAFGGAIYLTNETHLQLLGENYIEHNMAELYNGGGVNAFLMSTVNLIGNNHFTNNTSGFSDGAFTTALSNIMVQGSLSIVNNTSDQGGAVYGILTMFDFEEDANVTFKNNAAMNGGGAIYNLGSTLSTKGSLTFLNNSAKIGGAMLLNGASKLILSKSSVTVYSQNYADENGGAIYFADRISINQCGIHDISVSFCFQPNTTITELCKKQDDCFIELDVDFPFNLSTSNISLMFLDNSAGKSGTVFYGGSLDNCRLYLGGGFQDDCGNRIGREYKESALPTLLQISKINNKSSAISSEPFRVCFCDSDGVPDCEMNIRVDDKSRGEIITLSAVTVGQGNFTVPSSIKADFGTNTSTRLSSLQRVQETGDECTDVSYSIFSKEDSITMILFPDGPCRDVGIARREVKVTFLPCPDGFVLADTECACDRRLNTFNVSCNIDTRKIKCKENNFWMMAVYENSSYQGLLLHSDRCPFDFCVETPVEISLENPDIQCNHNHSGILCGSCQDDYSLALSSLHCLHCSNAYLALILVFALAGIALVVLLLLIQLTVVHGTINGLIFYANVIQVNHDIFFPPGDTNILTVFIAWLNLDLGIEICFYEGMNTYAFIWLQFLFPFYVWFLIGFIIFVSRYSSRISRLFGDNPVSVLAILFLLSYSKILRTIIAALSRTTLQYPDGTDQYVWLYDGSVPYFQRVDHILLGVFAICALLFLFLPYTILLLTGHWMQAHSHWKIFSWINKLKPFMDTYHAPFKKESRYWTGFLLLVRCVLFLTFALNVLGNDSINLLTIISVTVGLTALAWLHNRLYKKIYNDILEASFLINLCMFAAATYHVRETKSRQDELAYTSVGITFVIFICTLLYHIFCRISKLLPKQSFQIGNYNGIRDILHSIKSRTKNITRLDSVRSKRNYQNLRAPSAPITIMEMNEPMMQYTS